MSLNKTIVAGTKIDMGMPKSNCDLCNAPMHVQKTVTRTIVTIAHNSFQAQERVLVCSCGCRHPNETAVTTRNHGLAELVPAGSNYGYDIEVFVGLERFIRHRQREEIRSVLLEQYGISISSSEVSVLAGRFLRHMEILHKSNAAQIREAMRQDGGYTLHIDATTEDGRGTLLVAMSGWQRWALGAWKIPSESAKEIAPHITEICNLFGEPCAIIRDLGQPMASAVEEAAEKMSLRPQILACQYHFLRDIGKDILNDDYEYLRKLARRFNVRGKIRDVITAMRKKVDDEDIAIAKQYFNIISGRDSFPLFPGDTFGYSFIIVMAQWVLDYSQDSNNLKFPFDRPYYDFYQRCFVAKQAIDYFLSDYRFDHKTDKALERLKMSFLPFVDDKDIRNTVRDLKLRMELFDKFRDIFRFEAKLSGTIDFNENDSCDVTADLSDVNRILAFERFEINMRHQVETFNARLKRRYEAPNTNKDLKHAIKIIIEHLERHGEYLWGHLATLRNSDEIQFKIIDRTNNVLENFFRRMKHGERRRSGRKILTRDFECIPAAMVLATNLSDQKYVKTVCGSLDRLPFLFSKADREYRDELKKLKSTPSNNFYIDEGFDNVSMPDKYFVRKDMVRNWIIAASQGRERREIGNRKLENNYSNISPFDEMERFLSHSTT
jgi:hypothetical protein